MDQKVQKAMLPFLRSEFGNPSSIHQLGQRAKAAVEKAREQIAAFLGCSSNEIVFTSGATEANNLAIQGCVRPGFTHSRVPHVVIFAIEHESLLVQVKELEKQGVLRASYIPPGKDGIINPEAVEKSIKENTVLVSIQYVNSEIGTVQPIAEIGKIISKKNESSVVGRRSLVKFHTDAVQAANYLDCNVEKLRVDLLTLSSHKIYGPKGVGILYIRKGTAISPLILGGGQEQDMRPGTENVAGIVGMAEAIREVQNPKVRIQHIKMRHMRDKFVGDSKKRISDVEVTGSLEHRVPNNVHLRILGVEGKDVVLLLDQKGVAVSTGSACSERSQEPSHVVRALGCSNDEARSAVRITLGKYTRKEEMEKAFKALEQVVGQLRQKK